MWEIVSHTELAKAQADCQDVESHTQGKKPKTLTMAEVEFSKGNTLYCEVSGQKSEATGTERLARIGYQNAPPFVTSRAEGDVGQGIKQLLLAKHAQ